MRFGFGLRPLARLRCFPTVFGFFERNGTAVMFNAVIAVDAAGLIQIGLNFRRRFTAVLDIGCRVVKTVVLKVGFIMGSRCLFLIRSVVFDVVLYRGRLKSGFGILIVVMLRHDALRL